MKYVSRNLTVAAAVAAVAVAATAFPQPASAKVCKDQVTAKSRSAGNYSDSSRQSRAHANAIANWRDRARSTYGIAYRFWSRADERSVDCKTTPSAVTCTAKAKPCRLI